MSAKINSEEALSKSMDSVDVVMQWCFVSTILAESAFEAIGFGHQSQEEAQLIRNIQTIDDCPLSKPHRRI
jgi:hypothetical protein